MVSLFLVTHIGVVSLLLTVEACIEFHEFCPLHFRKGIYGIDIYRIASLGYWDAVRVVLMSSSFPSAKPENLMERLSLGICCALLVLLLDFPFIVLFLGSVLPLCKGPESVGVK